MKKTFSLLLILLLCSLGCNQDAAQQADKQAGSVSNKNGVTDPRKVKETDENEKKPSKSKDEPAADGPLYKGKAASFWVTQLQDKEASFRLEAVKALGEIGAARHLPALVNLYEKDDDVGVRQHAFSALLKLGYESPQRKPYVNTFGMKFVWIRPGSFLMGSPVTEKGRSDGEVPTQGNTDQRLLHGCVPCHLAADSNCPEWL